MSNKEQINTEYEATFDNVDILLIKKKMESLDGKVIKPNFIQKRIAFNFPKGHEIAGGFLRIRDEGDKITMTLKIMQANGTIEGQKEIELQVNNFENAVKFLTTLGAKQKAIQETKREVWEIGNVQVMLDERPFLEPFIELEGTSKEEVLDLARKLGLDWNDAIFDSVDYLYSKKYKISKGQINNNTPKIIFDMKNPFID